MTRTNTAARAALEHFEPLPASLTQGALVDPHDATLETEITEEMISLALDAMDDQQIWPYSRDRPLVAQPVRSARIIRFPGC